MDPERYILPSACFQLVCESAFCSLKGCRRLIPVQRRSRTFARPTHWWVSFPICFLIGEVRTTCWGSDSASAPGGLLRDQSISSGCWCLFISRGEGSGCVCGSCVGRKYKEDWMCQKCIRKQHKRENNEIIQHNVGITRSAYIWASTVSFYAICPPRSTICFKISRLLVKLFINAS